VIPHQGAGEMKDNIRRGGFRYLLVNYALLNRKIHERLTPDQQEMTLLFFTDKLSLIYKESGHGLYEVN
jgi:hypothetical protein